MSKNSQSSAADDAIDQASKPTARTAPYRPPWVKEGPNPLPVPAAPWTLRNARRQSSKDTDNGTTDNPLANVQLRKTSIPNKESTQNPANGNDSNSDGNSGFKRPQLKPVPPKDENGAQRKRENRLPETVKLRKLPAREIPEPPAELDREIPARRHDVLRQDSLRKRSLKSPPPPPPPAPPEPPPPPPIPSIIKVRENSKMTPEQREKLEHLKSRPKTRPDWTAMLKEIEHKRPLNHVQCNDRSAPLLPSTKAPTEHFLYESEQPNVHNVLLKQIETGVKLKKVKTNDRSKPMLEGLRKFRRQMTIEEQIQKSQSMAALAALPPVAQEMVDEVVDEMDDIDKVRDDLQSTRQMLALELRNKEALERENKKLQARIQKLESERESAPHAPSDTNIPSKLVEDLKFEAEQRKKSAEEIEEKYHQTALQLDQTKGQLEDTRFRNAQLEKRIQELLGGVGGKQRQSISKTSSCIDNRNAESNGPNNAALHSSSEGLDLDDDDDADEQQADDNDDDPEAKKLKKLEKEIKHLRNRLISFKHKQDNARMERQALRVILKNYHAAMRDERQKYTVLKKEVEKMAAIMKDVGDEDDDGLEVDDDEEEDDEEQIVEEVVENEADSSDDDEEDEEESSSSSEDSDSDDENRADALERTKMSLTKRITRHENLLSALKKGNYLLKTNAERLQDDLNKQKETTATLQQDLDSVLSELG